MRAGSADRDGSAASTFFEVRNRSHYARPEQVGGVLRRAQLQNSPPSGWKGLCASEGKQRPDRSGSGKHGRRDGRVVPSAERRLQGTLFPDPRVLVFSVHRRSVNERLT